MWKNCSKLSKINQNWQELSKIDQNWQKSTKIDENQPKSILCKKHCQDWLQTSVSKMVIAKSEYEANYKKILIVVSKQVNIKAWWITVLNLASSKSDEELSI